MAYTLTLEDLQKLSAMGVNVNGVPEGAEATPEEMAALGVTDPTAIKPTQPSIPVTSPDDPSVKQAPSGPAAAAPMVAPAAAPMAAQPAGGINMAGLLDLAQPVQTDPYENLSRDQRMMIGFAAIKDAGMALQGKEGNAVKNVMSDIADRADRERKRQAALAQRQMLGQLFGSGAAVGAGGGDIATRKQQIIAMMASGLLDAAAGATMISELNTQLEKQVATEASVTGAGQAIENIAELRDMIAGSDMSTGAVGWALSKMPWTDAYSARNLAKTLESNMALGALKQLKASGATLGAVSEKELDLLLADIRKINLDQKKEAVLGDLDAVDRRYKSIIQKAYRTGDPTALDTALGGRPSWLNIDAAAPSNQPSANQPPAASDEELFKEFKIE